MNVGCNVFGMMFYLEWISEDVLGGDDGCLLLEGLVCL